ncbi:MAG: sulfotransferase family protein [Verrucomicrobiota bacterium]
MKKLRKLLRQNNPDAKSHFVVLNEQKILYGRVPKVANSSIKETLARFLTCEVDPTMRKTQDRFWRKGTSGQARMVTKAEALKLNESYFSFSFVRNPFDRVVSCYNNKIIANAKLSPAMQKMKLSRGMQFDEFVKVVVATPDAKLDVHLLPQTTILTLDGKLVPKFVGRLENMKEDWDALAALMESEGFPMLGKLPSKNVRRTETDDVPNFFNSAELVDLIRERYRGDIETFYAGVPLEELIVSRGGKGLSPILNK